MKDSRAWNRPARSAGPDVGVEIAVLGLILSVVCVAVDAHAVEFGGIEFPEGSTSFADGVRRYDPFFSGGPAPTRRCNLEVNQAIGPPGFGLCSGGCAGDLSLGRGGLLILTFSDNALTNSGADAVDDLHVFEIGPDVEDTFVAVRAADVATATRLGALCQDTVVDGGVDAGVEGGVDFCEIGKIGGGTSSIDLDLNFPGFDAGELIFDAIRLIDDPDEGNATGDTVGADIDAVGAISSICRSHECGDLDRNGAVTSTDALRLLKRAVAGPSDVEVFCPMSCGSR